MQSLGPGSWRADAFFSVQAQFFASDGTRRSRCLLTFLTHDEPQEAHYLVGDKKWYPWHRCSKFVCNRSPRQARIWRTLLAALSKFWGFPPSCAVVLRGQAGGEMFHHVKSGNAELHQPVSMFITVSGSALPQPEFPTAATIRSCKHIPLLFALDSSRNPFVQLKLPNDMHLKDRPQRCPEKPALASRFDVFSASPLSIDRVFYDSSSMWLQGPPTEPSRVSWDLNWYMIFLIGSDQSIVTESANTSPRRHLDPSS